MSDTQHPRAETLSAWIDADLSAEEGAAIERHLTKCGECRRAVQELRAIITAAGELETAEPETDLWPQLEGRLEGASSHPARSWVTLLVGLAAGLMLAWGFGLGRRASGDPVDDPAGDLGRVAGVERYVLVLHSSPERFADATPEEIERLVGLYRDWAQELGREGKLEAGEKLAPQEGRRLTNEGGITTVELHTERGGLGGFFVIRAAGYDEAVAISRTCPHLEHGGWIELRRIEET